MTVVEVHIVSTVPQATQPCMVPARVDGTEIQIPCPDWCRMDHVSDNPRNLVDTFHFGEYAGLEMPRAGQSPALLAIARMCSDAFSPDPEKRKAYLYVEDGDGSTGGYQHRAEAELFARNLIAFGEKILEVSHLVEV